MLSFLNPKRNNLHCGKVRPAPGAFQGCPTPALCVASVRMRGFYSNLSNTDIPKASQEGWVEIWITHHCLGAEYRGERAQARPLTQGPVREAVHELEVRREGEDVEEVEEDVHSHDGAHVEQGVDTDALHLVVLAPQLSGAHLQGGTNQGGAEPRDRMGIVLSSRRVVKVQVGIDSSFSFRGHSMDYVAQIATDLGRPKGWLR